MQKKSNCWLVAAIMFIAGVVVGYWQAPRIMGWIENIYDKFCIGNDYDDDFSYDECDCEGGCDCSTDESIENDAKSE